MAVRTVLLASLALALPLAGCAKVLDTDKIEESIEQQIKAAGGKVQEVSCPDDRDAKKGDKFNCTAKITGGQTLVVEVEQIDDDGTVNYRPKT